MYKACIFDLDGTLTDTLDSLAYSTNATLREMGLNEITPALCRSYVGNGARRLIELSLKAAGDDDASRIDEAMRIYGRVFKENCMYHVKPYPGIVKMLSALSEKGIRLAVLSNKPHIQALEVVVSCFGKDTFDYVQGQSDDIPRKPDPYAVRIIMDMLHVGKDDCLYIGDSEVDMLTGVSAGLDTVGVSWGFRGRDVLKSNGAVYLADNPDEVTAIAMGERKLCF